MPVISYTYRHKLDTWLRYIHGVCVCACVCTCVHACDGIGQVWEKRLMPPLILFSHPVIIIQRASPRSWWPHNWHPWGLHTRHVPDPHGRGSWNTAPIPWGSRVPWEESTVFFRGATFHCGLSSQWQWGEWKWWWAIRSQWGEPWKLYVTQKCTRVSGNVLDCIPWHMYL